MLLFHQFTKIVTYVVPVLFIMMMILTLTKKSLLQSFLKVCQLNLRTKSEPVEH